MAAEPSSSSAAAAPPPATSSSPAPAPPQPDAADTAPRASQPAQPAPPQLLPQSYQQHQQSSQQYHQQHQHQQQGYGAPYAYNGPAAPFPPAMPALLPYNRAWSVTKLVFTSLALLWNTVLFGLSLTFAVRTSYYDYGSVTAFYTLPISIIAAGWCVAELITFCVRARKDASTKRGIHPGAHVGLHLIFWILAVFGILVSSFSFLDVAYDAAYCDPRTPGTRSWRGRCSQYGELYDRWGSLSRIVQTGQAILAMWALALISHFVLFVLACIETHRRNLLRPAGVVYVQQPLHPGQQPILYSVPPGGVPPFLHQHPAPPQQALVGNEKSAPPPPPPQQQQQQQELLQQPQRDHNLAGYYGPSAAAAPASAPAPAPPVRSPSPAAASAANQTTVSSVSAGPSATAH